MATDEWAEHAFSDVIDFQEGPGILAVDFRPAGTPLVRLSGLDRAASVLEGCNYLDPEMVAGRWSHFGLREGDVLLSTSASLGRIAVVTRDATGAIPYTGIIRMRPRDERVRAPFIRYLLEGPHFQEQVEAMGVGSVIRHFGPLHLRQMTVWLPSPVEQDAIAHILGALDDKIELNRRMNETLEAMARAIFKSWFVDFLPVRAKADGRQPVGMDPATAALFPDAFDDSPTGKIPKGWRVSSIGEEYDLTMGQSPPGDTYNEDGDGLAFYQGRKDFGSRYPTRRVYCTAPTRFADPGDAIVSVRAPVGDVNMAMERCAVGRGNAILRHRTGSRSFTYYSMCEMRADFEQFEANGTVFGCITKVQFLALPTVGPPQPLVQRFEDLVFPLDQRIEVNEAESQTLAAIRDALLPKLLSGEIRVGDVKGLQTDGD